jgi:hypothetical protein
LTVRTSNVVRRAAAACAILGISIGAPLFGQTPPQDAAGAAPVGVPRIEYGVRFGPAFTTLTSPETFDAFITPVTFEPALHFGGFLTIRVAGPLSLQPELLVAAKGQRIRQRDAPPIATLTGVKPAPADQVVLLRYLELPMLLRLSRRTRESTAFFLICGPAMAFKRNAVIREVSDSGDLVDISGEVSGNNLSVVYGAGAQHERWLVDARYTQGLRNVAVLPVRGEVKTSAFSVLMGVRF